jgi:hypothetical protein
MPKTVVRSSYRGGDNAMKAEVHPSQFWSHLALNAIRALAAWQGARRETRDLAAENDVAYQFQANGRLPSEFFTDT